MKRSEMKTHAIWIARGSLVGTVLGLLIRWTT